MSKYNFSMILSEANLFKCITMYSSLDKHCKDYKLFILCMNDSVYGILSNINLQNVIPIQLKEVEKNNYDLLIAKGNRIFHEYCWTLKPIFLNYVMNKYDNAEYYAHVDADLFLFSNIDYIFNENKKASIFLSHHRNSKEFENYYNLSGLYNTGFVGFKNNNEARAAVRLWGDRCIKKCTVEYDTINKTFGDQRYVEEWPNIFKNIHVIKASGANVAFWNVKDYVISKFSNTIYVNGSPLIFYHFSGVTILGEKEFDLCPFYHIDDEKLLNYVFNPYIKELSKSIEDITNKFTWFNKGFTNKGDIANFHNYRI